MDQQIKEIIENSISENEVCLFMKGTPQAPQCGFSMAVSNMLKILEVKYKSVDVLSDQKLREGIKNIVNGQLFHNYMLKKNLLVDVILSKRCLKMESLKSFLKTNKLNIKNNFI